LDPVPGDPGSGLGLSLCQAIVERSGGVIRVADTPAEEGTTMILDLPMVLE
jgi:signal transduction histidine kinase